MSKKLIAVASAAALALSALVATPATAAVGVQFFDGGVENNAVSVDVLRTAAAPITSATAYTKNVPYNNTLKFNAVADATTNSDTVSRDSSLLKIVVEVPNVNTTVTASATGAVRFIDGFERASGVLRATDSDTGTALLAKDGVATYSEATVSTGKTVTFYVYTTSTSADAFTISYPGFSTTYYLKGLAGVAYNLNVTAPTTIATTGDGSKMVVKVSDVFGNNISDLSAGAVGGVVTGSFTMAGLGGGTTKFYTTAVGSTTEITAAVANAVNYSTTDAGFAYNVRTTLGGGSAITVTLSAAATAGTAVADVTGLPTAKSSFFSAITSADLSVTVAALTAQVAALTADYNALATRWNKRYDLKKAPKNKVALK
jgi:hypothetical protein